MMSVHRVTPCLFNFQITTYMLGRTTLALVIVIVYVICNRLRKFGYSQPTLLHRIVAGLLVMIFSIATSLLGYYTGEVINHFRNREITQGLGVQVAYDQIWLKNMLNLARLSIIS